MQFIPHSAPIDTGWIEVITGCMFSGKTEELIRRLKRVEIAKQNFIIFKPQIDKRYSDANIVTHNHQALPSILIEHSSEIFDLSKNIQVIGIDETQFFDEQIVEVVNKLANQKKRIIISGLDLDYQGKPFGPMPKLISIAEYVTKTLAICVKCGNPAGRTQRIVRSEKKVLIGSSEIYEARCRKCHNPYE